MPCAVDYNTGAFVLAPPPSASARRTRVRATQQTESSTFVQTVSCGPYAPTNEAVRGALAAQAAQFLMPEYEPCAAVDLKNADIQMESRDMLLTLMPDPGFEAATAGVEAVKSQPLLSVDPVGTGDAGPLGAKLCAGRASPTGVISAAARWSVPLRPSRSRAEPLTPIPAPRNSEQYVCAFPECAKAYSQKDGVRKHARKCHAQWLLSNHKSYFCGQDDATLWDCAEATGWCVLDDSQVCTPQHHLAPALSLPLMARRPLPSSVHPSGCTSHSCTAPTRSRVTTSTWHRVAASSRTKRRQRRCVARRRS